MKELDPATYLLKLDLLEAFKLQLKKDFESSSCNADFVDGLAPGYDSLKLAITSELKHIVKHLPTTLYSLLYRIDISEAQLKNHQHNHPELDFEEALSELIIKRILQKVVYKKTFSGK